ncbi:MAG: hypothetical protein WCI73_08110, partial [Phycisphaerae bacterium]
MLSLLLGNRMAGGLHFGPAGWTPEAWALPVAGGGANSTLPTRWLVAVEPNHQTPSEVTSNRTLLEALLKQPVTRGSLLLAGGTVAVLSPANGVIEGLENIEHVGGGLIQALVIRQVAGTPAIAMETPSKPRSEPPTDAKALAQRLRHAGIGAYVPILGALADQLGDLDGRTPDLVLVNMLATQPESRLPYALAKLEPERLLAGVRWLKNALPVKRWRVLMDQADRRGTKTFR